MDVQAIDQQFGQLQSQAQQTVQALQTLGGKLQAAAQNGDQQAREWFLDLRELAISFKNEQDQMSGLLQAIHGFVANQAQMQNQTGYQGQPAGFGAAPPQQQQGGWRQDPSYAQGQPGGYAPAPQPASQQGGGMLGSFLNSGFGRAIEMGAGFGIGDELINKIF